MIKLPQGANIDAQIANGTQPNQRFKKKKNSLEKEIQPNFQKSPNSKP